MKPNIGEYALIWMYNTNNKILDNFRVRGIHNCSAKTFKTIAEAREGKAKLEELDRGIVVTIIQIIE